MNESYTVNGVEQRKDSIIHVSADESEPLMALLEQFTHSLQGKSAGTIHAYARSVRQLAQFIAAEQFDERKLLPNNLTKKAIEDFLDSLQKKGYSRSYRAGVKSAITKFSTYLMREKGLMRQNPARGIAIQQQTPAGLRTLTDNQRRILLALIAREDQPRSRALFAMGYWAGCRVSDSATLQFADVHVTEEAGWLHIIDMGDKVRDIDLVAPARTALLDYARERGETDSPYFFLSQRSDRLTDAGIHHWFRSLKASAPKEEQGEISRLAYHDLRHDFAQRLCDAGWTLAEVAAYLGNGIGRNTPDVEDIPGALELGRVHLKERLKLLGD